MRKNDEEVVGHDDAGASHDSGHAAQDGRGRLEGAGIEDGCGGGGIAHSGEHAPVVPRHEEEFGLGPDSTFSISVDDTIQFVATTGWEGPLPPPGELARYDDAVAARVVEWSDLQIRHSIEQSRYTAETERIAVEGERASATRGQWLSFAINAICIGAALASFLVTGEVVSFGFLAVPGVTIAVNIANKVRG